MKKKMLFLSCTLFLFSNAQATVSHFDIYGVNPDLQNKIRTTCAKEMKQYDQLSQKLNTSPADSYPLLKQLHELEESIKKKINGLALFSVATISTITYPNGRTYSTLDLVTQTDSSRLPQSIAQQHKTLAKKPEELIALFQLWNDYFNRTMQLMLHNQVDPKSLSCPVAHCIGGFSKKELHHELPKFKAGASQFREELRDILQYSPIEEERGQAIFLLANTQDYAYLAHLMSQFISDPSELVRNNSMRVLATILSQHRLKEFDIHPILSALNYPYVTDRNKAAYILWDLVRQEHSIHPMVLKMSGDTLVNLLKLNQPNNHDIAYLILKEISHQNYPEKDYQTWQTWVNNEKRKIG